MIGILSNPPKDFPTTIEMNSYFLEFLSQDVAIWIVRILVVLIFAGIVGYWVYLEHKNKPEE